MSWFTRMFPGLAARDDLERKTPGGIIPPSRVESSPVTISEAPSIPSIHRALSIITTSVMQLSLDVERQGERLSAEDQPALIRRPNLDMTRSEFLEQLTMSLAATGNAYMLKERVGRDTNQLIVLNPHMVTVYRDRFDRLRYGHDGNTYTTDELEHIKLLSMPGSLYGIGPIQAAQGTMRTARDMRDYASKWFETGTPSGVLSSEDKLTAEEARTYRRFWNNLDESGEPLSDMENPSRVKVLGRGLKYDPISLSPKDALWVDAQNFTTLEIARIFGVPSSLMLTAIDGNSMTYSNVEQEWLGFVRFGLMSYLRRIEEAFTSITPRGQTVRFNVEALLRSDTKSRYDAHNVALSAGFLTVNEVRKIENLPPIAGGDAVAPANPASPSAPTEQPAPAPADQETPA